MRRWYLVAGVVLGVLVIAGAVRGLEPRTSFADDDASLPVTVRLATDSRGAIEGDACPIARRADPPGFLRQVIVTNAAGDIVGKQTLVESTFQSFAGDPTLYCTMTFSMNVPKSDFYTVFIDDTRVTTLAKRDFPFANSQSLMIDLDDPD